MTLLLDVGDVPAAHCNDCIESLFKALAESPAADERAIWARHDNPWIAQHVEDVTMRLQALLQAIQDAFSRILTGEPLGRLQKSDLPWMRWSQAEFDDARVHLEGKPRSAYTLDDWLMVVDWLLQEYLPDDTISTEADYLTVRAAIAGKVQANMARIKPNAVTVSTLAELIPTEFAAVPLRMLSPVEVSILQVAKARAAANISDVTEGARHRMKGYVIEHVQAGILGQKEGTASYLRQRLFDGFGQLNRDFRRIAVTEAGECVNSGFIAAQAYGAKVQRKEAYRGACPFCQSINGKVFSVVDPATNDKDGDSQVWLGKSNIGRSASPRRREGDALVQRQAHELWWPAAGVQHPHCRGSWLPVSEKPADVSQEFETWLQAAIHKAQNP